MTHNSTECYNQEDNGRMLSKRVDSSTISGNGKSNNNQQTASGRNSKDRLPRNRSQAKNATSFGDKFKDDKQPELIRKSGSDSNMKKRMKDMDEALKVQEATETMAKGKGKEADGAARDPPQKNDKE